MLSKLCTMWSSRRQYISSLFICTVRLRVYIYADLSVIILLRCLVSPLIPVLRIKIGSVFLSSAWHALLPTLYISTRVFFIQLKSFTSKGKLLISKYHTIEAGYIFFSSWVHKNFTYVIVNVQSCMSLDILILRSVMLCYIWKRFHTYFLLK